MKKKIVSRLLLTLLLLGMLALAFTVQPVRASGSIYIRPDGTVEGTDKIQRDGDVYIFTDNIYDTLGIAVERDNIVIDGAGCTLQGTGSGHGIDLTGRNNVTAQDIEIKSFQYGIWLDSSSNCVISGNNIANNGDGIVLRESSNNTINGNDVTDVDIGIILLYSSNSSIHGNKIADNDCWGIVLWSSKSHECMHNNIHGNNITRNVCSGIDILGGSYNSISGNNLTSNGCSIWQQAGSNNNICDNNMTNSWKHIELYSGFSNTVSGNIMRNATHTGIDFRGGTYRNKIFRNTITNAWCGLTLYVSNRNNVSENTIANSRGACGVLVMYSKYNRVFGNIIADSERVGLYVTHASNNTICSNNLVNNNQGIYLNHASNNTFFHNNLVGNTEQVVSSASANIWDNGYPSGGNYWSDHKSKDKKSGPYQNETGSDGIADTPYIIDGSNQDNYPFGEPWSPRPPPPYEDLETLIETIESWNLPDGTENSLASKLEDATLLLSKGNENGAVHKLMDLINQVEALRNTGKLEDWQADCLATEAQRIINLIES